VERVRALFDLGDDPDAIARHLGRDVRLRRSVGSRPGLRVPGAWDPFELAVRAILGQQVSVAGATTLAGKLARAHGESLVTRGYADPHGRLTHLFPTPGALAQAKLAGLPRARVQALGTLAREVHSGTLQLDSGRDLDASVARLTALPGIGPWTAHYVAMRALREPDAFPSGDLVLRRALRPGACATTRELEARAEAWRPFRAYAAMHLWASSSHQE
jgi:3-methyladenine DNA glycosylase/8-oxoguanine DNA glycosylase